MAEIEFRQVGGGMFAVNLNGRRVGQIVNVPGGWQYQPAGAGPNHSFVGKVYARLAACKRSVTGEDTDDDR